MPGAKLHDAKGARLKKHSVTYDCRDNIISLIENYGSNFDKIVVSTWEDQVLKNESFKGSDLITFKDPGTLSFQPDGKPNNKFRQFFGIHGGLKYLKESGFSGYVIKIRSDNYVDVAAIISYFKNISDSRKESSIGVPISIPTRCYIQDFYFVGTIDNLLEFTEAQIQYQEFTDSVHNETILKYAFYKYRNDKIINPIAYFPAFFKPFVFSQTLKVAEYMGENAFFELPKTIFYTQIQRGSKISNEFRERLESSRKTKLRSIHIPMLCINLKIYTDVVGSQKSDQIRNTARIKPLLNSLALMLISFSFALYVIFRRKFLS